MHLSNEYDTITQRVTLIVSLFGSFVTPFMASTINVALPAVGEEFHIPAVMLSWIPTSYLLSAAVFLVPLGALADRYGRKRVFTAGTWIYAMTSVLCALSPSAAVLITLRVAQGAGAAMLFSTAIAILTSVFPPSERGKALGMNVSSVYLGLSLGPLAGGFLTGHFGWRSIFWANALLSILAIILVTWKLRSRERTAAKGAFDLRGSIIYAFTLTSLIYGLIQIPRFKAWILIGISAAMMAAFFAWERRIEHPVVPIHLFRGNRVFGMSNAAALLGYSATFMVTFLMSLYLQYVNGFTPQQTGIILLVQPAVMTVLSLFSGRLSDFLEPRVLASSGLGLTSAALVLFGTADADTPTVRVILFLALLGSGIALFSSPNTYAVMSSVERSMYGAASALLGTMRLTGQMVSMAIAALFLNLYLGETGITPRNHELFISSMHMAFFVAALLCVAGICASLVRGKVHSRE